MAGRGRQAVIAHRLRCLSGGQQVVTASSTAALNPGQRRRVTDGTRGTNGNCRTFFCDHSAGDRNCSEGGGSGVRPVRSSNDPSKRIEHFVAAAAGGGGVSPVSSSASLCVDDRTRRSYASGTTTTTGGALLPTNGRRRLSGGGCSNRRGRGPLGDPLLLEDGLSFSAGSFSTTTAIPKNNGRYPTAPKLSYTATSPGKYPATSTAINYPATATTTTSGKPVPCKSGSASVVGVRAYYSARRRWRTGGSEKRGPWGSETAGVGVGAASRGGSRDASALLANCARGEQVMGAGIGGRRGFASTSSPPEAEQYLRYIHRVKPSGAAEDVRGNSTPAGSFEGERHPNGISPHAPSNGAATTASTGERPNVGVNYTVGVGLEHDGGGRERFDKNDGDDDDLTREMTRKWLQGFSAEDILRDKNLLRQQLEVRGNCTVDEAVTAFVNERVTSFVVVNRRKEVIGMFTSRDLLTELAKFPDKADGLKTKAHEFMIPLAQMIYCSPKDSLYQCLLVMSELKVRNLPVVSEGKVMGIVNVNDISDFSFSMEELGGKKAYMKNISERKGLPKGVGLDPRQNRSGWKQAFSASAGAVALPHPHKMPNGNLSANTREHRHLEIAEDPSLSEDAHFMLDMAWPTPTTDTVHYVGLADGVGSWRKLGVDPREFSHRLMHWASQYIISMAPGNGIGAHMAQPPPKPHQVLRAAWEYTIGEKVVGSSTAIVAALDYDLEQLTFSNIGDCGVVVLRHIDSDVAGYMREKKTPRYLRDNDLRLAFISQQQLRSFNLPYQFGYTNVPEDNANFETPRDAVNTSFPVRPGDIIVLATDGLYDNMELDDICSVALDWEHKWFGGPMEGLSEHNNAAMEDLAQQLGHRARELSLDNSRDSPFALLAKENDIMWGGGMPDDITIVALRVINKAHSSAAAVSKRGVGPDDQDVDEAA